MSQDIDRVSVTFPPSLFSELDDAVIISEYDNRSEATRDALYVLVTKFNQQTGPSGSLSGAVIVPYKHDRSGVSDEMIELQHDFIETIITIHHAHLDDYFCLESIAVGGAGKRIEELLPRIRLLEGVHQVRLTVAEADRQWASRERL